MPELVTRFVMGQDVPEWLLVAEPEQPGAPRGFFRFCVDVDVIDTPAYYVVLPNLATHAEGAPLIDNTGMIGHRVMSASKPVALVCGGNLFFGAETTPHFREIERRLREHQERLQLADAVRQIAPVPDPHPTFWSRLKYAFRGR